MSMRRKRKYPICEDCGAEINPHKYEDCEYAVISNGREICKDCFIREATEFMEINTKQFAELIGAEIVEMED